MPNPNPAHMKLAVWLLWAGWMMPVALVWVWIDGSYMHRLAFGAYVTGVITGWVMCLLAAGATSREANAVSKQDGGLVPAPANDGGQTT